MDSEEEGYTPLFETKEAKGRLIYRIFAGTILAAICMVWIYRAITIQKAMVGYREEGRSLELWGLIGLFCAEIWFGFYWILTQSLRWRPVYRYSFKERLLIRLVFSFILESSHCFLSSFFMEEV